MPTNQQTNQANSQADGLMRYVNLFNVAYAVSAVMQIIGTWNFFGQVGGGGARGFFYSVSGAVCLELMILGFNFYGKSKTGFFRFALMSASIVWIGCSAAIQIFDIRIAHPSDEVSAMLQEWLPTVRVLVAIVPSAAMAAITVIKYFGDKGEAESVIEQLNGMIDSLKAEAAKATVLFEQKVADLEADIEGMRLALAAKDGQIIDLSARLDEAKSRPVLQQLVAPNSIQSKVALPEPEQMPVALAKADDIDLLLSSDATNEFMRALLNAGKTPAEAAKAALVNVGILEKTAENAVVYDKRLSRLYTRARRWQA